MLDAKQQRRSVIERLYHCKTALVSIGRHPDEQTEDSLRLLAAADRFLLAALVAFEERWIDAASQEPGRVELEQQLLCDEYTSILLEFTTLLLPTLEGATPRHIPVHLLPFINAEVHRFASGLGVGSVVLSSSYQYNYSVQHYTFDQWYDLSPETSRPKIGSPTCF